MSDSKKPPFIPPAKDEPKKSDAPARGPGVPGGPGPFVESPEPKEKQSGAPATSENEQAKRQADAGAARAPEGHLRPDLQRVQAEHSHPEPPAARLVPPKKDDTGHVEPGALAAPRAGEGPAPRFVSQNERAPEGLKRFRIRSDETYGPQPVRYVLARNRHEAEDHYLHATGLNAVMRRLGDRAPDPMLAVVALPD